MASKIYAAKETPIVFKSSGGSAAITCTSLANNAGRVSAQYDRGSGSKPTRFLIEVQCKLAATPTVGSTVSVLLSLAEADATVPDGDVGQSDAALSALNKRRNLRYGCVVEIDVAGTGIQKGSDIVEFAARYVSVVVINEGGSAFSATAGDTIITLTPIPDESQ